MDTNTLSARWDREHISTYPDLETHLRALGVALITFQYVDGDPCGEVSKIQYLDAADNFVGAAVTSALQQRVQAAIERDALQFLHGLWIDCNARVIRWRLE
jgi:hypothetical protein